MDIVKYWQSFCATYLRARFGDTERGASLVEYALLVALIAVVCIIAVTFLGNNASSKFNTVGSSIGGRRSPKLPPNQHPPLPTRRPGRPTGRSGRGDGIDLE